jgi:hypothetical protein
MCELSCAHRSNAFFASTATRRTSRKRRPRRCWSKPRCCRQPGRRRRSEGHRRCGCGRGRANKTGGEGGIRTPDTLLGYSRSPGVRFQPLSHLSAGCPMHSKAHSGPPGNVFPGSLGRCGGEEARERRLPRSRIGSIGGHGRHVGRVPTNGRAERKGPSSRESAVGARGRPRWGRPTEATPAFEAGTVGSPRLWIAAPRTRRGRVGCPRTAAGGTISRGSGACEWICPPTAVGGYGGWVATAGTRWMMRRLVVDEGSVRRLTSAATGLG